MSDAKPSRSKAKAHKLNQQTKSSLSSGPEKVIDPTEPTKLDYEIAKYLRNNLPDKMAMFVGIKRVNYFIGSKAVDLLMESKYKEQFKTRDETVLYLNGLLIKNFYHRAKKIVKTDGQKKKFKLDMHNYQVFEDSKEPYVWLYEPTSLKAWLLCLGLILLVVVVCLFPLWPPYIRTVVYYACIGSLILLSSFLALSLLRHVIYIAILGLTFGKIKFWLLPNLTEDVGFFESFVPVYTLETEGAPGLSNNNDGGGGGDDDGDDGAESSSRDLTSSTNISDTSKAGHQD